MNYHLVSYDTIATEEKISVVLFEKIEGFFFISFLLAFIQRKKVYIIEPFNAYHHSAGYRLYPKPFPPFVEALVQKGFVTVLPATLFDPVRIFFQSREDAVRDVEKIYTSYYTRHRVLIDSICSLVSSPAADRSFRRQLCINLGEYYSVFFLIQKITKAFPHARSITFYPDTDVLLFSRIGELVKEIRNNTCLASCLRFSFASVFLSYLKSISSYVRTVVFLVYVTANSLFKVEPSATQDRPRYKYAISIISERQFYDSKRTFDFLIDGENIKYDDVVFIPFCKLSDEQKKKLSLRSNHYFFFTKKRALLLDKRIWSSFFSTFLRRSFVYSSYELQIAYRTLSSYIIGVKICSRFDFKHFITHADFHSSHIGRNIALSQAGVKTWYFLDSMNHGYTFGSSTIRGMSPDWTYLTYDNLVVWDQFSGDYFCSHPGVKANPHIVGCLWSQYIQQERHKQKRFDLGFTIGVYDSTYTRNCYTSVQEGIQFAEHMLELLRDFPHITIRFKEKKNRKWLMFSDPVNGPKLIQLYETLSSHQRVFISPFDADSANIAAESDLSISFPFTSTTYESLSVDLPAIWHDPMALYRDTPYGRIPGVTTHGYEDLRGFVEKMYAMYVAGGAWKNPIPLRSSFLDPFRDGLAIQRFRALLAASL